MRNIEVPTGNILIIDAEGGKLECLSLADYGKEMNVKCDALGLSRKLEKVEHTELLPLSTKWVVTISTQHGCSMGCNFCDVPKVGPGRNASLTGLFNQVKAAIELHPEVGETDRLNLHYARMGEPTFNPSVLELTRMLAFMQQTKGRIFTCNKVKVFHPVISTMMPKHNSRLLEFLKEWMFIKNRILQGEAGLQLSLNSTNEEQREVMFNSQALSLQGINGVMAQLNLPKGRKITLNFAVADWEINPEVLLKYFSPDHYLIKLTPMHKTTRAVNAGVQTTGDYTTLEPYLHHEEALKKAGYDVLVFIASEAEDQGRITCGNAILSGSLPKVYKEN